MIRYHVIPHSHWDREWYLSFDEFRGMLVNMIDDLVDILERDPDYKSFLLDGQTVILDDYLAVRPDRRERLDELVRAGRLFVGPWHVLPDSFLVSGEALIRNLLIGTGTAMEFGSDRFVGYIPDSFGHTAQIPQIFRGFGIDTAIFWRGFGGEPGQEGSEYRWASPDGSWVLAEHLTEEGYSGAYFESEDRQAILETFVAMRDRVDSRTTADARLILSGGDHHWPVSEFTSILRIIGEEIGPERGLVHSDPISYFDDLREGIEIGGLPEIVGEQRFGYQWAFNVSGGVYSSRMYLKQANARCQRLLEGYLERLDAVATANGRKSQAPLIRQAWRDLIANHPHDSICGCSIDSVHREMETRFEKVDNAGKAISRFLWQELTADGEGLHADDTEIIVFNPSAFARSELIECDVEFLLQEVPVGGNLDLSPRVENEKPDVISIVDEQGRAVPFEMVNRRENFGISLNRYGYPAQSRVDRWRIRFLADTVPAVGFGQFSIQKNRSVDAEFGSDLSSFEGGIENSKLRLSVDERGAFFVVSKVSGEEFGPLGVLEDSADAGDEYNYSPPDEDEVYRSDRIGDVSIEWIPGRLRSGIAVAAVLQVPMSLTEDLSRRSTESVEIPFRTTAWLSAGSPLVTFETELDNRAADHRLRVIFETGCNTEINFADSAFGVVERRQREFDAETFAIEVPAKVAPAQRFVAVEHDGRGAAILNDGLPEYEHFFGSAGTIALTLLRSVGELAKEGLKMRPGGRAGWYNLTPEAQCFGAHEFRYAFMPYEPSWHANFRSIEKAATSFLEPLRPRTTKTRSRDLPKVGLLTLESESIVVSALKPAEDGNGIVLRTYNATPSTARGEIVFGRRPRNVRRVGLDEQPMDDHPVDAGDTFVDDWKPYQIKTFRLEY